MAKLSKLKIKQKERDEKLQYLVDLFRLSYRTYTSVQESVDPNEPEYAENLYDAYDVMPGDLSGLNSDEGMEEDFKPEFEALGALDTYYECCIDYYEDRLHELDTKLQNNKKELKTYYYLTDEEIKDLDKYHRKYYRINYENLTNRINLGEKELADIKLKLIQFNRAKTALTNPTTKDKENGPKTNDK